MKTFPCTLLLLSVLALNAQQPFGPSNNGEPENLLYIELLGGAMWPTMIFTGTPFDREIPGRYIRQNNGIALRYNPNGLFSFSALLSYRELGVYFLDLDETEMKANYLNVFLPVEMEILLSRLRKKVGPSILLFTGPYVAYFLGGSIEDRQQEFKLTGGQEINRWDAGAEAGVGFRIPTFSIENRSNLNLKFSFYYGLINTFPPLVPNEPDDRLNSLLLSKTGTRFNQGFRLTLSYEIALRKHKIESFTAGGDGKKTYKRFVLQ